MVKGPKFLLDENVILKNGVKNLKESKEIGKKLKF